MPQDDEAAAVAAVLSAAAADVEAFAANSSWHELAAAAHSEGQLVKTQVA
jgi:hypothetical protein